MTGRVCPVHGEYAPSGVCRWCEKPKPSGVNQSSIWLPLLCCCQTCLRTFEAPIPLTSLECPECRGKPRESAIEKAAREYFATSAGMRPLGSTLRRYSTPEGVASHAAFWEAKLAKEHAALRWERVARRWNWKHHGGGGTEEGRAYVWRWWLEQMDRQSAGLPLAGPFPLGFYAW